MKISAKYLFLIVPLISFSTLKITHNLTKSKKYKNYIRNKKNASFYATQVPRLRRVPLLDNQIVKSTKIISIKDFNAPYNPAVIESNHGLELIFRYDSVYDKTTNKYHTGLYQVQLNEDLDVASSVTKINTGSLSSEDPRLFTCQNKQFLLYNDLSYSSTPRSRLMYLSSLESEIKNPIKLDLGMSLVEKNWTPFIYNDELHFVYKIFPHKIITTSDLSNPKLEFIKSYLEEQNYDFWKWGEPRGGTPAIEYKGQFLSFFHSSFKENEKIIYVFGAYTFENKPPFKITGISPYPILFKEAYSSAIINTADRNKRVLFPTGLVKDKQSDDLLVFCGENDAAIRVLRIDGTKLLESLKQF